MSYCSRCGVEVEQKTEDCPLCNAPIQRLDESPPPIQATKTEKRYPLVPETHRRSWHFHFRMALWAGLSAIFLISFLVVLVVNLIWTGGSITWSSYALSAIGFSWLLTTSILILYRWPWIIVLSNYPNLVLFLALLDLCDGGFEWFLPLGLPVVSAVMASAVVQVVLWTVWKDRGTNQLAIFLALIGMSLVGVDLVTTGYFDAPGLSWSIVAVAVLVPLSGFFFIYHYALRRVLKLERFFHT